MEERYVNPVTPMSATPPVSAERGTVQANHPGTANAPSLPNIPNTPNMPNMTSRPESATPPDSPNLPSVPAMANRPNSATMPNTANTPNSANSPNAPKSATTANNAKKAPNNNDNKPGKACTYKQGELPSCAPLAAGYVPYQQKNPPKYSNEDALTRGTLFPGLDLPFMNVTNKNNPYAGTPLGELMALGFAIHELKLYLDTHKNDKDAFDMMCSLIKLEHEGQQEYAKRYGPVGIQDIEYAERYTWTDDPWPWDYAERTGK